MRKVLVTGSAGFIGFHLSARLCQENYEVIGIDNLNDYYDVGLKKDRLSQLQTPNFRFEKLDLCDLEGLNKLFEEERFDYIVNLAAQAGVRNSINNPQSYIDSNIQGFMNLLECCRYHTTKHLIYASSSSVYGANTKTPFSIHDNVDHPVSLYAATKKANELMAHTYSTLYNVPATGLRFFTVYGPWGRPDMALFKFTGSIIHNEVIDVYNNGQHSRDFTYIDDIIESIIRLIPKFPEPDILWNGNDPDPATSFAPHKIFNIGNNNPTNLMDFITTLERIVGKKAEKNFLPMQPGDVEKTYANVDELVEYIHFKPRTALEDGIKSFLNWYKNYYEV